MSEQAKIELEQQPGVKDSATISQVVALLRRMGLSIEIPALLFALIVAGALGPSSGGFYFYVLTIAGVYSIATLGNNILLVHGGLLSLGQGGLMAIGAYTFAIVLQASASYVLALGVAIAISAASGLVLGLPALRLSGHNLALVTLAFTMSVVEVIIVLPQYTGGAVGLAVYTNALSATANFYAVLIALAAVIVGQALLVKSRFGQALHLVRDSERAAAAVGINVAQYKLVAFIYSGILAGAAGVFLANATGYLTPNMFDFWLSVNILVAVVVGGMISISGAIFGALLIAVIPQLASAYPGLSSVIFGVALMLAVFAGARVRGR
jgi:branched-chain amino acid transport system permease protein